MSEPAFKWSAKLLWPGVQAIAWQKSRRFSDVAKSEAYGMVARRLARGDDYMQLAHDAAKLADLHGD